MEKPERQVPHLDQFGFARELNEHFRPQGTLVEGETYRTAIAASSASDAGRAGDPRPAEPRITSRRARWAELLLPAHRSVSVMRWDTGRLSS